MFGIAKIDIRLKDPDSTVFFSVLEVDIISIIRDLCLMDDHLNTQQNDPFRMVKNIYYSLILNSFQYD